MYRYEMETTGKRVLALLAVGVWLATATGELMAESKRIVYIEASPVNNWKLDGFAARTGIERYRFEVLREYDFDKSKLVDRVLAGGAPWPDAVIVQECSAYFPGDMQAYRRMYRALLTVIATVVPPARSVSWWQDAKDFIKKRLLGRPGRLEQVVAFNEWLRTVGAELKIPVFDLERLLRVSAEDRYMRAEYSQGDGVHLAPVAYQRLDTELLEFLDRLEWRKVSK